jgi:DNA-binding transcriptional ArsR family regulator
MQSASPSTLHEPEKVARARRRALDPTAESRLARLEQVFCEQSRLRIVQALREGALSVGDLAAVIERTVPGTSQHLRVLRKLGVVEGERRGSLVYYRLSRGPVTVQVQGLIDAAVRAPASPG